MKVMTMFERPRLISFTAVVLAALSAVAYAGEPSRSCADSRLTIAITVDDLPFADQSVPIGQQESGTKLLLRALEKHDAPAIGFVNEDKILVNGEVEQRISLLRDWLEAGMSLGNHGFGHLDLQTTPLRKAEAAVLRGDVITRWLMGQHGLVPHYYRYPYNHTGPTKAVRAEFVRFLSDHGYAIAPFTIQNGDYVYDRIYTYDLAHGNTEEAHRVRKAYLAHLPIVMAAHEKMTKELFGHQVAQIFDLHADRINAASLDTILGMLEDRGYCFVSLKKSLEDPAYDTPDTYAGRYGMTWIRRWAKGRNTKFSVYPPDPQNWVVKRYRAIIKKSRNDN